MVPKDSAQDSGNKGGAARFGAGAAYPGHRDSTTSSISGDSHRYLGHSVLTTLLCKVDTTIILKLQVGKLSLGLVKCPS